jgi:tRNA (guanine26-N2/guanine27-N2)-dimethyltransferase
MRNDRSKGNLSSIRGELATIMRQAGDGADAQSRMQALLWRLDHPTPDGKPSGSEVAGAKGAKEGATAGEEANRKEASPADVHRLEVDFDEALGKEHESKKLVRYQTNPRADWGPLRRAR